MKISTRGQITIPKALRDRFGLHKDVEVELISKKDGLLIQKRSGGRHPVDLVFGHDDSPFDAVLELPNVTRPAMVLQGSNSLLPSICF